MSGGIVSRTGLGGSMLLTKPPKKRKRKAKAAESATGAQTPHPLEPLTPKRTSKRKKQTVAAPVAPLIAPLSADSEITPTALASLPGESFKYGAIFGPAGSGKTHLIRETLKINPQWGLLCATTGVA